jgi:hypothetical protein
VGFLAAVADRFLKLPGLVLWGALSLAVGMTASRWAIAGSGTEDGRPGPGTGA